MCGWSGCISWIRTWAVIPSEGNHLQWRFVGRRKRPMSIFSQTGVLLQKKGTNNSILLAAGVTARISSILMVVAVAWLAEAWKAKVKLGTWLNFLTFPNVLQAGDVPRTCGALHGSFSWALWWWFCWACPCLWPWWCLSITKVVNGLSRVLQFMFVFPFYRKFLCLALLASRGLS